MSLTTFELAKGVRNYLFCLPSAANAIEQ